MCDAAGGSEAASALFHSLQHTASDVSTGRTSVRDLTAKMFWNIFFWAETPESEVIQSSHVDSIYDPSV